MLTKKSELAMLKLYDTPLPSTRSGALYNAFSYPTKISPEVIAIFIASHTRPGDYILDVFGGSGTTGIAAKLCDVPTENMKKMVQELGIDVTWGPRNAYIYELSVLGSLIADVMCTPPCPKQFEKAAVELIDRAEKKIGALWAATGPNGEAGELRHIVWSDVLICPSCGHEESYYMAAVQRSPLSLRKHFKCSCCDDNVDIDGCERAHEEIYDRLLEKQILRKKRVPARVYGISGSTNWQREPLASDLEIIESVKNLNMPVSAPVSEIEWGDLYRSGYHSGITHLHHFYTDRSFLVFSQLWDLVNEFPESMRFSLKFWLLSYNSSHSTLMSRVVVKNNQKDLVLTGAQSGVLYISGLPVEKNILRGLKKKIKILKKSFEAVYPSSSKVEVYNASSEKLNIKESTIDYLFTDPPFGDYIPYAEINQINECWLGKRTNRSKEAIISISQGKGLADYQKMLGCVFLEVHRVMKDEALATVVFHSAKSKVWKALTSAYLGAGLSVKATSILDKLQSSFKQTVSTVSVKGDPLILLSKQMSHSNLRDENVSSRDIFENIVSSNKNSELDKKRLLEKMYSSYIGECLSLGIEVELDAKEFYEDAEAHFELF